MPGWNFKTFMHIVFRYSCLIKTGCFRCVPISKWYPLLFVNCTYFENRNSFAPFTFFCDPFQTSTFTNIVRIPACIWEKLSAIKGTGAYAERERGPLSGQIISQACSFAPDTEFTPLELASELVFVFKIRIPCVKYLKLASPFFQKSVYRLVG